MDNNQGTQINAPEKGTWDFDSLAKELEVDRKLLENTLTGKETKEEAILKLAKKSGHAQKEMFKTKQEKADLEKQLESFTKSVTQVQVGAVEGTEEKGEIPDKEIKTTEEVDKIKKSIAELTGELGILKSRIDSAKDEYRTMRQEQVDQIRLQKVKDGFAWLVKMFGEERAYELFNPSNLKESPVGRILHPDTNKSFALYWDEIEPIRLATLKHLSDTGLSEDMAKALQKTSLTEEPGKSVPSEEGPNQGVEKLAEMIGLNRRK